MLTLMLIYKIMHKLCIIMLFYSGNSIPDVIPSEDECENFLKAVHHVLTEIQ